MSKLGIVADDVTGATTVGALIAREGIEATVLFNHRSLETDAVGHEEVLITSTDSRSMEPEVAFGRVRHATEALIRLGAAQFSKRIDTTCRGGIGPEVEGMLTALGDDYIALIVPAMPQSKRIVVDGYSLIDSVLLAETAVAQDVRTPVVESHLPTLFASQFSLPLGHVALRDIQRGHDVIATRLAQLRDAGNRAIVLDAVTLEHVDEIAQAAANLRWHVVCVDPGPFTQRYAVRSGQLTPQAIPDRMLRLDSLDDDEGTVLVVAGSATSVTHQQITELCGLPGTVSVATLPVELVADEPRFERECQRVLVEVRRVLDERPPRVLVLALENVLTGARASIEALEVSSGLAGQRAASLLTQRFGLLARQVADALTPERCTGMYLTGGDVMINACYALGAKGLTLVDYVIPQIDQARITGGPFDGTPVVCKGGLTGTTTTAIASVNRLFDERKPQ